MRADAQNFQTNAALPCRNALFSSKRAPNFHDFRASKESHTSRERSRSPTANTRRASADSIQQEKFLFFFRSKTRAFRSAGWPRLDGTPSLHFFHNPNAVHRRSSRVSHGQPFPNRRTFSNQTCPSKPPSTFVTKNLYTTFCT